MKEIHLVLVRTKKYKVNYCFARIMICNNSINFYINLPGFPFDYHLEIDF